MQKLIIATIGLSLSMGVAATAVAQSAQTPGQMQSAPAANGDSTMTAPASGSMPSTSSTQQSDPSSPNAAPAPGAMSSDSGSAASSSSGTMASPPQSYPRCSASVHDECRQRQ